MPSVITYANQHGQEIHDGLDEIYDDESHMSEYSYHSNDEAPEDDDDHLSYDMSVAPSEHGPHDHPDADTPEEIMKGSAATPAANHLFNPEAIKLDMKQAEIFHHLMAKLLYLCKCTRPDLQMAVAFLTTRVQNPDIDDFKKLGRCLQYIQETKDMPLILTASDPHVIRWWVDASFAVHPDMKSHMGATRSMCRGSIYSLSTKQNINTRSSTEAELVGVNDAMSLIIWTRNFLEDQGFSIQDNVVFQDNESAMLLEWNGHASSSKCT